MKLFLRNRFRTFRQLAAAAELAFAFGGAVVVIAQETGPASAAAHQKDDPELARMAGKLVEMKGWPLFPSQPVSGYPGADSSAGRPPWGYPEAANDPWAVEHFRIQEQKYLPPWNPFNRTTLVKNFLATELPNVDAKLKETFAEPVQYVTRNLPILRTGEKRPPVPVVRLKPGGQRLAFQMELPIGMYVVRLIAAIEPKDVKEDADPKELVLDLKVNDGLRGETSHYVLRQRATDNFYSLGEFYFHAVEKRVFRIETGLHPDSKIDLLVHHVDVHDVLAPCARRAGKKESVLVNLQTLKANWASPEAEKARENQERIVQKRLQDLRKVSPGKSDEELLRDWRRDRDEVLWNALPPINSHWMNFLGPSPQKSEADPETEKRIQAAGECLQDGWPAFGWAGYKSTGGVWRIDVPPVNLGYQWSAPWRLVRDLPNGTTEIYTLDDLRAQKPLPGLPVEVPPWGRRFAWPDGKGTYLYPQVQACSSAFYRAVQALQGGVRSGESRIDHSWVRNGDREAARDFAMLLCRVAYDLPSYNETHAWNYLFTTSWNRLAVLQHRTRPYQAYEYRDLAAAYDKLFLFIKDNQELALAVGRFIPWVKTPADVVRLLDTHLLQYGAAQTKLFRYYYSHEHAAILSMLAAIQGDPAIVESWMETVFSKTWEYPHRLAGVKDYIYLSTQRDGTSDIGSFSYGLNGGIGVNTQRWIERYLRNGGNPKYSLENFTRVRAGPFWFLEGRVAGMHPLGVGDVGGPSVQYGEWFRLDDDFASMGWRWTKDPRFAFWLLNYGYRTTETDAEWKEIQAVGSRTPNPFMANRSRVLSDWGGILEGGTHSDDFRFRHAARVRVGMGRGHAHEDTMDLGLWSLGLPLAGDGGARGGYARPAVTAAWMHNLVTIDKASWMGHAWITDLADLEGCQYLRARALHGRSYVRQVALVEVDQGKPSATVPTDPKLLPGTGFGKDVVLPRAYFVDFVRVEGGKQHAYNFHGPPDDEFVANVTSRKLTPEENHFLDSETPKKKNYILPNEQWGGTVDSETLTATWRVSRADKVFVADDRGQKTAPAAEPAMMGASYDPDSPRKYLRMHMPGQKGNSFLTGVWVCAPADTKWGLYYRQTHVLRDGPSSLFAAVFEPYADKPFLQSVRLEGNPSGDARNVAALRVATVDGQRDLCFTDEDPSSLKALEDGTRIQAQFAYLSRDAQGFRQVDLVGGKALETAPLKVKPAVAEWKGALTKVDYAAQEATLDSHFPAKVLDGAFFEVGMPQDHRLRERWTSYEAGSVKPQKEGTIVQWRKGADVYEGEVEEVALNEKRTDASWDLKLKFGLLLVAGQNTQLVVTNEKGVKQWRGDVVGEIVTIYGEEVTPEDFKAGEKVRIYNFGKGDLWRTPSKVSLRRAAPGVYRVRANAPCEITVASAAAECSRDGIVWKPLERGKSANEKVWRITEEQLVAPKLMLRWPEGIDWKP